MFERQFCKIIVIAGTLLIWTIKWLIRPYIHLTQPTKYFLGIAPNLIGAFLLPMGCNWLLYKFIDLSNVYTLKLFTALCFGLLVINEFLQLIPIFGRTFDVGDIIASAVGLLISYVFCGRFVFKKPATYP